MVSSSQRGSPHDVALPADIANPATRKSALAVWDVWARAIQASGTPAIMQINHPGRQAMRFTRNGPCLAPSAIPLNLGPSLMQRISSWLVFGTPRAMTQQDIDTTVAQFAETARLAADAGFKGIEVHAAHGYLLAQFLSAKSNVRTDGYGGSAKNRARLLREVVQAIRAAVPKDFAVGIKLNSADFMEGLGKGDLDEVLAQIEEVVGAGGVDFLEISGGTYENPRMMGPEFSNSHGGGQEKEPRAGDAPVSARTKVREAFFLDFATEVRSKFPGLVLMVTGGFRTRQGMKDALEGGACDVVGLGRPSVTTPRFPKEVLFNEKVADEDAKAVMKSIEVPWLLKLIGMGGIGGGLVTLSYQRDLKKLVTMTST